MAYYKPSQESEESDTETDQKEFTKELLEVLVSSIFFCGMILLFGLI